MQTEPDLVDMVQTGDSEVFRSCKERPCYLRRVGTLSAATSLPLLLQAVWWGHALFFRPGGERRRAPRRTASLWEESSLDSASTPRRDEETPHHFINCRPVLSIADVAGHGIMVRAWEREDHCSTSANEGELSRHSRGKTPPNRSPATIRAMRRVGCPLTGRPAPQAAAAAGHAKSRWSTAVAQLSVLTRLRGHVDADGSRWWVQRPTTRRPRAHYCTRMARSRRRHGTPPPRRRSPAGHCSARARAHSPSKVHDDTSRHTPPSRTRLSGPTHPQRYTQHAN